MKTYTIRNLTAPEMTTEINGTVRQALYVKIGMQALHMNHAVTIEDEDGYIIPEATQKRWLQNIIR